MSATWGGAEMGMGAQRWRRPLYLGGQLLGGGATVANVVSAPMSTVRRLVGWVCTERRRVVIVSLQKTESSRQVSRCNACHAVTLYGEVEARRAGGEGVG